MMKNIIKSFALILALIVAMTLSVSVLAEGEDSVASSDAVSTEAVSDGTESSEAESSEAESSEAESSEAESSEAESSEAESSEAESSEASAEAASSTEDPEASSDLNANVSDSDSAEQETANDFPWARVITLIVIAVLIVVAVILAKTNTPIGQKISKFFKEYMSEIKKVAWSSPKDTAKATGIVLTFLIVAAVAIGILDLAFTQFVKLIAEIFN